MVMVLQCLLVRSGSERILGSHQTTKTGLVSIRWQLLVKIYRFLSVGFLYKSDLIFPPLFCHIVSRNGIEVIGSHEHSPCELSGVVWDIVNFIFSCISFISSKYMWSVDIEPV